MRPGQAHGFLPRRSAPSSSWGSHVRFPGNCAHPHTRRCPRPATRFSQASTEAFPTPPSYPRGQHVRHTWQHARAVSACPPTPKPQTPWLRAPPRVGTSWAGCATSAPPPGGRQVHRAGREGAVITRPRRPTPHAPFIPGHACPGSRRSLPPPARSLAGSEEDLGVRQALALRGGRSGRRGSQRHRLCLLGDGGCCGV